MAEPPICLVVGNNFHWPQAVFVPLCLVTIIAISALAIQGKLTTMQWGYGMTTAIGLALIMNVVNLAQKRKNEPEGEMVFRKRQMILQLFICAIEGVLVGLAMAGIIPVAPAAITLISLNGAAGYCCLTSSAPALKYYVEKRTAGSHAYEPIEDD